MSISGSATSRSTDRLTARPLTRQILRPFIRSSRVSKMASLSSSSSNPWASRMGKTAVFVPPSSANIASTYASSHPARTRLVSARPPKISITASKIMDFPAPVSPVNTLNPASNRSRSSSIIAKLRMNSSFSIMPNLDKPESRSLTRRRKDAKSLSFAALRLCVLKFLYLRSKISSLRL